MSEVKVRTEQTEIDYRWAYLILRAALGADLIGHGAIRLFGNYAGFREWLYQFFASSPMPTFIVTVGAWTIAPIELVLGALLLFGLKTRLSVLAASLVMIGLICGGCVAQKWEIVGLQLNYIFFYCLLIAFSRYDFWSVDSYFRRRP